MRAWFAILIVAGCGSTARPMPPPPPPSPPLEPASVEPADPPPAQIAERDQARPPGWSDPATSPQAPSADRRMVQAVVRAHRDPIVACYEAEQRASRDIDARVMVHFEIDTDGKVARATTDRRSELADCVRAAFERMQFPAPTAPIAASYPVGFDFAVQ